MFEVTHFLHYSIHKTYQKAHSHKDPDSLRKDGVEHVGRWTQDECQIHKSNGFDQSTQIWLILTMQIEDGFGPFREHKIPWISNFSISQ